ncbi:MAG: hypothetical protein H6712_12855 [Myxococcales bacterium]|nr:HxsD-like protein [Myxococcales bacterium]MCB9714748.1 hypothetical protein [Myxococcales bacterium]
MKELRFHRELYPGEAVDSALRTFEGWAELRREQTPTHWIVRVTARSAAAERKIAGELANFALGLTVRRGPPA